MKLIIALDFKSVEAAKCYMSALSAELDAENKQKILLKIGMWLFYSAGPKILEYANNLGFKIFIDLKLNDIPNTVAAATRALCEHECEIISVHSAAGLEGLQAAVENAKNGAKIFAITVLTSMQQKSLENLGLKMPLDELVISRANLAKSAGCAGVVCSAHEAVQIKQLGLLALCPGIREAGANAHDQARVATLEFAKNQGADFAVIGRAIIEDEFPVQKAKNFIRRLDEK